MEIRRITTITLTFRRMIADGERPAERIGREYRISEKVMEALLVGWTDEK